MSKIKKRSPIVSLLLFAFSGVVVIVLLALLVFFVEGCYGKLQRNASQERAKPFFEALEKYHGDHGRYPNNFDVLVPKYSEEKLPSGWRYENHRRYIGNYLYAPSPGFGYSEFCYSSISKNWHLDDDLHNWFEHKWIEQDL